MISRQELFGPRSLERIALKQLVSGKGSSQCFPVLKAGRARAAYP
jgi:hypothetical protein